MPKDSFTTKDLMVLHELLTGEELMFKKCSAYAAQATDSKLRTMFNGYAQGHKKRFNTLFSHLGGQQ